MSEWAEHFPTDYAQGRERFVEAATAAGAALRRFDHPLQGPDGEPLSTDVAVIGPSNADSVLLVNSGTHGGEGFCGSGILAGWLRARAAAASVRQVLVHAINPHGFAWIRRVTEGNVDLNRNFIDHARAPANPGYDALAALLVPENWTAETEPRLMRLVRDEIDRQGLDAVLVALMQGQYAHPDGIFYGGGEPTWSNRTFRTILREEVGDARRIVYLDLHTGLGPYGHCQIMHDHAPGGEPEARSRAVFGDGVVTAGSEEADGPKTTGSTHDAVYQHAPNAEITDATLEFGTRPMMEVLAALMADNWMHLRGDPASQAGLQVRARMRRVFYPDEPDWKELVFLRASQILRRSIDHLSR